MFLVSNTKMLIEASQAGIMGCIPSLNFRTPVEFENALIDLQKNCPGAYGINLIVNQSNVFLKQHLLLLEKYPPHFVITSLGSPKEIIDKLSGKGVRIICDVTDLTYAKKVESLGADAVIAVNSGAGGHRGNIPSSILIPLLKQHIKIPIIAAGGIGTGSGILSMLSLGADGCSIGSPFIASQESEVNQQYKEAVINYGASDIVLTSKISGTPCTVINTPYQQKVGTELNFLEKLLIKNKQLKKYVKMLTYYKGMKSIKKAAFSATYKTIWCAGPSIEFSKKIETIESIVKRFIKEYELAKSKLDKL
jgi:nitronate monooxygenase